jgi:hypothetical protein
MEDMLVFYLGWFLVTTAWTLLAKETKKESLFRYVFTFIFVTIIYFLFNMN